MNNEKGYFCKYRKGIKEFEPIFIKWHEIMDTYAEKTGGDYFHFYRERENVSALSAAAWRNDYVAMSEFSHEKSRKGHKNEKYTGRCDLYIGADKVDFYIEAKHEFISLNTDKEWSERLKGTRSLAISDAKSSGHSEDYSVLGVTFFGFYIPKNHQSKINNAIDKLTKYLEKKPFDSAGWYFPNTQRSDQGFQKNILPGCIMVVENLSYNTN